MARKKSNDYLRIKVYRLLRYKIKNLHCTENLTITKMR